MVPADNFILGNSALHDRFRLATEILAATVSTAPAPVAMADLEHQTGRSDKDIGKVCALLERARLLERSDDGWTLTLPASAMTLEDVFRCVVDAQSTRNRAANAAAAESRSHDIDLLMMQATMEINQSVFQHLRRFSLDRLKSRASSMANLGSHYFRRSRYDDAPDFAFS